MQEKKSFKDRWEELGDITELLQAVSPKYRDPDIYYKDLIENEEDVSLANRRLSILENQVFIDKETKLLKKVDSIRVDRDLMLKNTDYTQLPDIPLSSTEKSNYREYRKYLRDLPERLFKGYLNIGISNYDEWSKWASVQSITPVFPYKLR